jgi:chromosome segregation ATPase
MSTTPNVPQQEEAHHYESGSTPRWIVIAFVVVVAALGFMAYTAYDTRAKLEAELGKANDKVSILTARLDQANSRLADMTGQVEVIQQRSGMNNNDIAKARSISEQVRKDQKASDERLTAQLGQVKRESDEKIGAVANEVGNAKKDIEATRGDLEATKGKLERAIGDAGVMSGLIARNREDLEDLKRRGERNIFEFTLQKSKNGQKVGPIQIFLQKVDAKKQRYTMTVNADDKSIEKKDKTVGEPVQFYVKGQRSPYEIVVFEVVKDRATGYLTTPKDAAAVAPAKPQS